MDSLFFHPKVVHIPIALAVLMPLVAGGLALAWWRGWLPWRAWFIGLGLQVALVTTAVVAVRTGEAEEERVEPYVPHSAIERHEEAAMTFVWVSGGVLALMLAAAALGTRRMGLSLAAASTVGTWVVLGFGYRTGEAGGELVYRHGAARAYVREAPATAPPGAHHTEADDD